MQTINDSPERKKNCIEGKLSLTNVNVRSDARIGEKARRKEIRKEEKREKFGL